MRTTLSPPYALFPLSSIDRADLNGGELQLNTQIGAKGCHEVAMAHNQTPPAFRLLSSERHAFVIRIARFHGYGTTDALVLAM